MAKQITVGEQARQSLLKGVNTLKEEQSDVSANQ